jgi:hypothetical protein
MTARETARRHARAWRAKTYHAARMSEALRPTGTIEPAFPQFRYY